MTHTDKHLQRHSVWQTSHIDDEVIRVKVTWLCFLSSNCTATSMSDFFEVDSPPLSVWFVSASISPIAIPSYFTCLSNWHFYSPASVIVEFTTIAPFLAFDIWDSCPFRTPSYYFNSLLLSKREGTDSGMDPVIILLPVLPLREANEGMTLSFSLTRGGKAFSIWLFKKTQTKRMYS